MRYQNAANTCLGLASYILWNEIVCVTCTEHTVAIAVCVLMEGLLNCLWLPIIPHHSPRPLPNHPSLYTVCAIHDIKVAVKQLLKIQQCYIYRR